MKGLRRRTKKKNKSSLNVSVDTDISCASTSTSTTPSFPVPKKKKTTMLFSKLFFKGSYTQVKTDPQQVLGGCPQCQMGDCAIRFVANTPALCWVPVPCCLGVHRVERVQCLHCQVVFDSPEEYRQVCANRLAKEETVELVSMDPEQTAPVPTNLSICKEEVEFYEKETLINTTCTDSIKSDLPTIPTIDSKEIIPPTPPSPTSVALLPLQEQEPAPQPPITDEFILQDLLYRGHFQQAQHAATSLLEQQEPQTKLTTLCLLDMALNGQGKTIEADRLAQDFILPRATTGSFPRLVISTPDYRIEAKQCFAPQQQGAYYVFQVYYKYNNQRKRTFELQRERDLVVLRECFANNRTMDIVSGGAHPIPTVTQVANDVMDYLALEECWEAAASPVERTVPVVV